MDLYEINEAFAVVTMAAISELELDPEIVNVHGGAWPESSGIPSGLPVHESSLPCFQH